jgi:hypothetical protein
LVLIISAPILGIGPVLNCGVVLDFVVVLLFGLAEELEIIPAYLISYIESYYHEYTMYPPIEIDGMDFWNIQ